MAQSHFSVVAIGGTFDHLHDGHIAFLERAYSLGTHVYIGVTTDSLVYAKRMRASLQKYETRVHTLTDYLISKHYLDRTTMIPLNNMYGIAAMEPSIEALIVTKDNKENGVAINVERKKRKLKKLTLVTCDMIHGNDGEIVRSTRIRCGEIDRHGNTYRSLFPSHTLLQLPQSLRKILREPLGEVIKSGARTARTTASHAIRELNARQPVLVCTVGDVVTQTLLQNEFVPNVAIIDFITRRKDSINFELRIKNLPHFPNPAGTLHPAAVQTVCATLHDADLGMVQQTKACQFIPIDGEEDLLTLPAILCAPLGAIVLYGQVDKGIVMVHIDEAIKDKVAGFIAKFERAHLRSSAHS